MVPGAGFGLPKSGAGYFLTKPLGSYEIVTHFLWHNVTCICADCIAVDEAYARFGLTKDITEIPQCSP